ncbi:lysosome membrane protein 2-like [Physella acuta]|uniref:lysosome membrane protein 2-like n=1 Tax=Physella acuta TaxID=109671 RepID=UPI0027DC00B1|nr:lysosome membrane protein 2-like [Physella acuta]XP_059168459.1 lysosome membrane protein 2-like [Physella acuta]
MVSKKGVILFSCGLLGVVFLVVGCVLINVFDTLIHSEVKDGLPLTKGSASYKNWQSPKSPIYFQVWMFNVVNRMEIIAGEKPAVAQMGPYTYREHREKVDINYYDNGTLTYRELRSFVFQPDMSVGSENDTFYTVNLPALTIMSMLKREYTFFDELVDLILNAIGERLFIQLSVHDLMWGYEDPLLKDAKEIARMFNRTLNMSDYFGLFYNQNNTDDGLYQIYSGVKGIDNFGKIVTWNQFEKLPYWTNESANMINGTDGTIYPPFISTKETKYLFSSDLCRSLGLDFTEPLTVKGIGLDRFVAPDIMFGNVTVNPYNAGFCTPAGNCLPSGLLNVSVCRSGAPVIMSMPHFLGCDQETIDTIVGLRPDREEHQSYIDIEPMTGVAMNVGKRLQINTYIEPDAKFQDLKNIKKPFFMPVMWLNESAVISDSDASDFRSEVLDKIKITTGVKYGLIVLGAVMIIIVILVLALPKLKDLMMRKKEEAINKNNEDDDDVPILFHGAS